MTDDGEDRVGESANGRNEEETDQAFSRFGFTN